jgi:NADH dehydrogenase FAD-containing subunit
MDRSMPVVAIIGAGFGGLNSAKALRDKPGFMRLIDMRNYHLFQINGFLNTTIHGYNGL